MQHSIYKQLNIKYIEFWHNSSILIIYYDKFKSNHSG